MKMFAAAVTNKTQEVSRVSWRLGETFMCIDGVFEPGEIVKIRRLLVTNDRAIARNNEAGDEQFIRIVKPADMSNVRSLHAKCKPNACFLPLMKGKWYEVLVD